MTISIAPPRGPFRDAAFERLRAGLSRRGLLGAAAGLAATGLTDGKARARDAVQPHVLDDFFRPGQVAGAALSPSGERVAVLLNVGEGGTRRMVVDLIEASDPSGPRRRVPVGDLDVETLAWANDRRVMLRLVIPVTAGGNTPTGRGIANRTFEIQSRRVVSMDLESGEHTLMFGNERVRLRESLNLGHIVDYLPEDPSHVLMAAREYSGLMALHRVNVDTGRAELVERGSQLTMDWSTINGVPVMRRDISTRGSFINIFVRPDGQGRWRRAWRQPTAQVALADFIWIGAAGRAGHALVAARLEGEDVLSVRDLDLETLEYGPPMASRQGLDVSHSLVDVRGRYMAAAYYAPRLEYDFTDASLAPHHRAMNGFFGNECNVHLWDVDAAHNRFVIRASGPRDAGSWYLYDKTARHFEYLGSRTLLDTRRLAPAEAVQVRTRDGAAIEAYVTAPPGGAPGPVIALVHGGPEARDVLGWDRQAQILASRGWWVVQPQFRGSGGFGRGFASQGWKRWGDRMQEDVEDALAQVIRDRGLDAARVGIMGGSYGGYAALMGAVRRPDLYKAAISICGVGDLGDALSYERRDDESADGFVYNYWISRIGDPRTDAAAIAAASPRLRAAEIACPVLLVHGVNDRIVQVHQSRRMHEALRAAGKSVEYVEVPDAGHGDWEDDVEKGLMQRYVALFARAFA
ncbi:MAG: alpha/beta hydrolase family protein [Brevundimonas sp.]|uniref:alpha/beta hydrolase family protein n=1 Tax=Brevundimonas sp. TaxID=1871086 RepID=UPI00391DDA95